MATTLAGISVTTLVNNWFVDKRGLATGLAFAGSGVSAAIMTPVLTTVVTDYGWAHGLPHHEPGQLYHFDPGHAAHPS